MNLPSPYGDCEASENYVKTQCISDCEANYVINNCSCKDVSWPGKDVITATNDVNLFVAGLLKQFWALS